MELRGVPDTLSGASTPAIYEKQTRGFLDIGFTARTPTERYRLFSVQARVRHPRRRRFLPKVFSECRQSRPTVDSVVEDRPPKLILVNREAPCGGSPGSLQPMQVIPRKRYTLFLRSRCAYACGDHEMSAFVPSAAGEAANWIFY